MPDESPKKRKADESTSEEKKLAVMMMPRKKRKLYDKIMHSKKQKASEVCYVVVFLLFPFQARHFKTTYTVFGICEYQACVAEAFTDFVGSSDVNLALIDG